MAGQSKIFDAKGRFILRDFDRGLPFSSFLPGIAGLLGIPLWVFYVNRGQAISSLGIESKDRPILEFQAAHQAYQLTSLHGFRTFLRGEDWHYEPFHPAEGDRPERNMFIGLNELEIEERAIGRGLQTNVLYYTLPEEPFGALVRRLALTNISGRPLSLEVLDGLPGIVPAGVNDWFLKNMGHTLQAWMEVVGLDTRVPLFKLVASPADAAEVKAVTAGNFALAMSDRELLPVVVDPAAVFGRETSRLVPEMFAEGGLKSILSDEQITRGRAPCAFFGKHAVLASGETLTVESVYGHAATHETIIARLPALRAPGYVDVKRDRASQLAMELTDAVATSTSRPAFDAYCRQTMLDNILRGGWPLMLGEDRVYHVYSRKHGDPERDYNQFLLAAEPYSQGNGNYRDVSQNRRNDLVFQPRVGDANIRTFMSLIRTDGYNPLIVHGDRLSVPAAARECLLEQVANPGELRDLMTGTLTLGELVRCAIACGLRSTVDEFLDRVLELADWHMQAEHGEGFWSDHWAYNLDLIDGYLALYPDREAWLLFESPPLAFFDSEHFVRPRSQKYVLIGGEPRQSGAITIDPEKAAMIRARQASPHWVRSEYGRGDILRVPLISKLVLLGLLKFATLDVLGLGVEMEAGKPGWCDAMNGLPGMFGSSLPETFQLLRLLEFLAQALDGAARPVPLPIEGERLLRGVMTHIARELPPLEYWDAVATEREVYRERTRLGLDGDIVTIDPEALRADIQRMAGVVEGGIERALALDGGMAPTYFAYRVVDYELRNEEDDMGRPLIRPLAFELERLPDFLEGAVRQMHWIREQERARDLHRRVKESPLYDGKLGMYRLNLSLVEQPHSIGRARAFPPGWLENESIWLHMSYKYLLELLRAGLDEEFFADMQRQLVPFFEPGVYGRSVLENSSFLVSSAHPDATLHGTGFVARLTGATAEFLSLWALMMMGERPFRVEGRKLRLSIRPSLPGWLFKDDGTLTFRFLGNTEVTLHNRAKADLRRRPANEIVLTDRTGRRTRTHGGDVGTADAVRVREGQVAALDLYYS